MLLIFGSAKLLAEGAVRLGSPAIVGEIIAGILIGPSVLGWVAPNEVLSAFAELGVMFLLFRVGLECKSTELLRVGGTATLTAVLGVIVPMIAGWGVFRLWGYGQIPSAFMGAAMVATSVGITAQVLGERGLLHLLASKVILAAAVIDDVLGLIVLAIVSGAARGSVNLTEIALITAFAVSFTLLVAWAGSRTMQRILPRVEQNLAVGEAQFNLSLLALFALAVISAYAGVAAIIGAFLAGMAMAETIGKRVHDLVHGVTELFVPFFLVNIGLQLQLAPLRDPAVLTLGLIILAAAVLSKFLGCGLGAWKLGWTEMQRIGAGMIPRGEVGMVVAQIGLASGAIDQAVYGIAVFMAIFTTVIAPPLLKFTYRDAPVGRRKADFSIG
jgi:Kef-type K+ transport system membrane component KefB